MAEGVGEADALEFVSLDASSRQQVFNFMHDHPDAVGVISAVGLLTRDYHLARQMNGDTATHMAAGMCHPRLLPHARKFVYISAEPYHRHFPYLIGHKRLLKGYFQGKRIGEEAVLKNLGDRGLVLRPGFIYGTRFVGLTTATGTGAVLALPLWLVGKPLDWLLSAVGGRRLFAPPTDVEVLAEAAVRACAWATLPDKNVSGIADVYKMKEMAAAPDPAAREAERR
ncbi:hypothetical protein STCU_03943 [Strigomonas culicis]|nr:hypothetical protein STCU_03943 [Strigomonas culicis]|eukprot:EPY30687.1 hypothetical protein STCU_03943 [Strigomonas culicis]